MADKKTIRLIGGPFDGQIKEVEKGQTLYIVKEQVDVEDIEGELPVSPVPNFYEITYEESPEGSGVFLLKE